MLGGSEACLALCDKEAVRPRSKNATDDGSWQRKRGRRNEDDRGAHYVTACTASYRRSSENRKRGSPIEVRVSGTVSRAEND
jgi:hypothetical protein